MISVSAYAGSDGSIRDDSKSGNSNAATTTVSMNTLSTGSVEQITQPLSTEITPVTSTNAATTQKQTGSSGVLEALSNAVTSEVDEALFAWTTEIVNETPIPGTTLSDSPLSVKGLLDTGKLSNWGNDLLTNSMATMNSLSSVTSKLSITAGNINSSDTLGPQPSLLGSRK
jgi:hypothetical protein